MNSIDAAIALMRADMNTGKATKRSLGVMYAMIMAGHRCIEPDFWGPINRVILEMNDDNFKYLEGVKKVAWEIYEQASLNVSAEAEARA